MRDLLAVPDHFRVFLTGDEKTIIQRVLSAPGSKSGRIIEVVLDQEEERIRLSEFGSGKKVRVPDQEDVVNLKLTDVNTGIRLPANLLTNLSTRFADLPVLVDANYAFPFAVSDYANLDGVHFSTSTGFGLPHSLHVWMVDADRIRAFQPALPEPLAIYLLDGILADYRRRGLAIIRSETVYKSTLLYHALEVSDKLVPLIPERSLRSPTIIAAKALDPAKDWKGYLKTKGIDIFQDSDKLLIANFPVHSREQFEMLVDVIQDA